LAQKIKFIAASDLVYGVEDPPVPAKTVIPDWFKKIPPERENRSVGSIVPRNFSTVKKCVPYLDALTTGYMLRIPQDINIVRDPISNEVFAHWGYSRFARYPNTKDEMIIFDTDKPLHRHEGLPVPPGYLTIPWRLEVYPTIETPKGYSSLITHPFNRYDLPFLSLTGVIDTDNLHVPLAVTLYLREDFVGILEKGTPVAQVLPFKRENWTHEVCPPYDDTTFHKTKFTIQSNMIRSYSKNFWAKKSYD